MPFGKSRRSSVLPEVEPLTICRGRRSPSRARRLHVNHHVGRDRDRLTVRWVLLPRRRFELRGDTAIQARWRVRTGHRLAALPVFQTVMVPLLLNRMRVSP